MVRGVSHNSIAPYVEPRRPEQVDTADGQAGVSKFSELPSRLQTASDFVKLPGSLPLIGDSLHGDRVAMPGDTLQFSNPIGRTARNQSSVVGHWFFLLL